MSTFWVLQLLLQLFLAVIGICTPTLLPRQSVAPVVNKAAPTRGIVSGIGWRDEKGNVPVRREIRDLKENYPEQWMLYMLGLSNFQWLAQDDPLSYYGIASIHGRPYKTWGDAPGLAHKVGTTGYCPHNNALFLGWHRPYLALFEERLYKSIQQSRDLMANRFQTEKYDLAARSFRMPYWDWSLGEKGGPLPEFFTQRKLNITYPDGFVESIYNPLYAFYFHPGTPEGFDEKWKHLNFTQRWPDSDKPTSQSNQTKMVEEYVNIQRQFLDSTSRSFRRPSINEFAQELETVHGWMHGVIGGGFENNGYKGHMWPLEYSAYEPLFMLHHTNIDRLFAMYQVAHPERKFIPASVGINGNVFLENEQIIDSDTELLPFRKRSGGFWTTNDAWQTETLGYAYPETIKALNETEEEQAVAVSKAITQLYSPSVRRMLENEAQNVPAGGSTLLAVDGNFTDWAISTSADSPNLPPTFVARFVLRDEDSSVNVGSWVRLMAASHSHSSHADNNNNKGKKARASTVHRSYTGSVSLTASLLEQVVKGKVQSLDKKHVVSYLKDNLTWKVVSDVGMEIPHKDLDGFTFEVVSTQARIPQDPEKPVEYSEDVARHPEVTSGKAGGVVG